MGLVTGCSQLGVPTAVAVHSSVRQPQRGTLLTGEVERHVQLPRRILRFPCINVFFFAHRHFLFWPRVFSILVLSAPRHARREPARTPRRKCGPWPRWHCAGGSKSQVTTARHSEHVEPSRSMQTHVQVKQMSNVRWLIHVISGILNVVNVIRHHYDDGNAFPLQQLARQATSFSKR